MTIIYGMDTFSDCKIFVTRWSERFQKLLNVPCNIDHEALDNIPQSKKASMRTMVEMPRAFAGLKDGKAPGEMEFLLKYVSTEETIRSADCTN